MPREDAFGGKPTRRLDADWSCPALHSATDARCILQRSSPLILVRRLSATCWSERRDLNPGPPVPQTGALTGLRYAPPFRSRANLYAGEPSRARAAPASLPA